MSKNPADRYKTAQDMADDLQRFLDNKPILAHRPTVFDRVRKWSRRHPSMVVASVLLLVFSIAGLVVNNYLLAQEQRRTQKALDSEALGRKKAEVSFTQAEVSFTRAREAVDLLIQVSEEELGDKPFQQGLRRILLEAALNYYKGFIDQRQDDKNAIAALEATQDRVKRILEELTVIQGMTQLNAIGYFPVVLTELKLTPDQLPEVIELSKTWEAHRRSSKKKPGECRHEKRPAKGVRRCSLMHEKARKLWRKS